MHQNASTPTVPTTPKPFLSDTSPIIALSCQSLTESVSALFDQNCKLDWSKLLHVFLLLLNGFVKIDTWISLSCYMDLSKLIHGFLYSISFYLHLAKLLYVDLLKLLRGFVQLFLCISRPLSNKTKPKFDPDFKAS